MKILVIGRGGRESSIVKKVLLSPLTSQVYCAPGNAQTATIAQNVDIEEIDISELLKFALNNQIDLTIVGPESSLECGIVDLFSVNNLLIFGPTKNAALIETSKSYSKDLMKKHQIPTAEYATFNDMQIALDYAEKIKYPHVIKYDGLAAGKGVVICNDYKEMKSNIIAMFKDEKFGSLSRVILEEYLDGEEFTLLSLVKDENVYPLEVSRDYKRAFDGDKGLNTGGMGAICPFDKITKNDKLEAVDILQRTARALVAENNNFCGVLYGGFIKTAKGIKVIEFNARFGDPETEVVLQKLQSDLVQEILNLLNNQMVNIVNDDKYYVGVTMAALGYPESYIKDITIADYDDKGIFHMGSKLTKGVIKSTGGRVIFVSDNGNTLEEAREKAYNKVEKFQSVDLFYRQDIAKHK